MIKTVIFDIGNVLTDFAWQEMYKEKGLGGETFDRVAKATVQSPYWCELDRGIMTFSEVMDKFVKSTTGVWYNPRYIVSMKQQGSTYAIVVAPSHPDTEPCIANIDPDEAAKLKSE